MPRILGLDLGSHALKAVLLDVARTTTLAGWAEVRRGDGTDQESLRAALATLHAEHPWQVDQVVVAMPGTSVATHALVLPFKDAKRLEAALPFEVESELPVELEDVVFDYQAGSRTEQGTELLVGVIQKSELRSLLALLSDAGFEPRVVTHPALVYRSLFVGRPELVGVESGGLAALVDIGHVRTTVAIGQPGQGLIYARVLPGGGRAITVALEREFGVASVDAERWKEQTGSLAPVGDQEHARAREAIRLALQPLTREVRATLKAATTRDRRPVGQLLLCGGTSQLAGLPEAWAAELGLPVKLLGASGNSELLPEQRARGAQAWALALCGGSRADRFNFRRGDQAFSGQLDWLRGRIPQLAIFAGVLVALLVTFGVVRSAMLGRREAAVDTELCELTRRVLGTCERNYDRALNLLRGKESPAAALPKVSAAGLLAEVAARVPPDITLKLDQVVVDLDRVQMRGETDSSKTIDRLSTALKGFRCFRDVKEGKVERTKDGARVSFQLDVLVDCGETAPPAG
ncbi:MAG: type II secretion system protein GspL [Myxococcaceae bacterium]